MDISLFGARDTNSGNLWCDLEDQPGLKKKSVPLNVFTKLTWRRQKKIKNIYIF